jgi:hypothetical protein
LSLGVVDVVVSLVVAVIVVSIIIVINLANRDYPNIIVSSPGYHPAHLGQNPPVVSYASVSAGNKEVLLRVDIYQNPLASLFNQLPNHLPVPFIGLYSLFLLIDTLGLANWFIDSYRIAIGSTLIAFKAQKAVSTFAGAALFCIIFGVESLLCFYF